MISGKMCLLQRVGHPLPGAILAATIPPWDPCPPLTWRGIPRRSITKSPVKTLNVRLRARLWHPLSSSTLTRPMALQWYKYEGLLKNLKYHTSSFITLVKTNILFCFLEKKKSTALFFVFSFELGYHLAQASIESDAQLR